MAPEAVGPERRPQNLTLLSLALTHVREVAFFSDENAVFHFVNEEMCRVLGYSCAELLGMSVPDIDPEFPLDRWFKHWNTLKAQRSLQFESRYRTKTGRLFPVEINANYFEFEGQGYCLALVRDLTTRQQAEEALRESEKRYQQLLHSITDYIYTVQVADGRPLVTVHGPGCAAVTGYTPEDYAADPGLWYRMIYEPDRAAVMGQAGRVLAGESASPLEHRILHRDGSLRWVRNTSVPHFDPQRRLIAYDGLVEDITERKQAEQERSRLQEQLQQAQKLESVGRLAGGVAHDFNNILAIVNGCSEIILANSEITGVARRRVLEILKAGQRGASLTRQLLAFSRKQILQPKVLSLNLVLEDIDKMMSRLIGEEIELKTVLDPNLEPVTADPGQMEQVILNFCINARDAMPEGGRITIETANVTVDDTLAAQHFPMKTGRYVRLTVMDTGTGMDKETLAHIFEPFFSTKGPDQGTGLGLATVYGIVQQSGGHVWASSEPGRGTTFSVYLPAVSEEIEPRAPEVQPLERTRGSETILLVEDSAPLRALASELLANSGYTVLTAEDGEQAVQLAQEHKGYISLLLTDVSLPKIKGPLLASRLQQQRPEMKILYVSGYADNIISPNGVLQPDTAFLQKPFTGPVLCRKVREVLDAPPGNPGTLS